MQQNAEKQLFITLGKFKLARDWVAINGCLQNIKEVCLNFHNEIYETPHKLLLAKTLSQCLSPSLPAGVQSSALDVYHNIFETAGDSRLLKDFYIWAPGLLQFFHSAGVAQRVSAIKLFSDFFVPLIPNNHRIAPPLILSILPGLTDDGTEVQSLVNEVLLNIKTNIGINQFWKSMFRASVTHPFTRSAFLIFAIKAEPAEYSNINNKQLTVSLFNALFSDSNMLVVRSALELFLSCYSMLSQDCQKDLVLKCVNLLTNEDQSIRRRVFNWMKAFSSQAVQFLPKANPVAIKIAFEKGGEIKTIAIQSLPQIISRGEFDISLISKLIEEDVLLKAADDDFDALLRVLTVISPKTDKKSSLLSDLLIKIIKCEEKRVPKLAEIALILMDSANSEKHSEIGTKAINQIFNNPTNRENKVCLQFSIKLLAKLALNPDFNVLMNDPLSFSSIDTLISLSTDSLSALIVLDNNAYRCISRCLTFLSFSEAARKSSKNVEYSEICQSLVKLYHSYSSHFTICIEDQWNLSAIMRFITFTTEIPLPLVIISQKEKNRDFNLLRMIVGHSQLLLADIKRLLTNEDLEYTRILVKALEQLIDIDKELFVSSITDGSLLELIKFLLSIDGTSNLLYFILSSIKSAQVLNNISDTIENFVLSNPSNEFFYRLLIPLSNIISNPNTNSNLNSFIDLIPQHSEMLNVLLSIIESVSTSSETLFHAVDMISQRVVDLLSISQIDEPILYDISKLFRLVTKRSENEIIESRATMKSSTLRRVFTAVEDLSTDNCVASLTVNFLPDYTAHYDYSSIGPKFLPKILNGICKGFTNPLQIDDIQQNYNENRNDIFNNVYNYNNNNNNNDRNIANGNNNNKIVNIDDSRNNINSENIINANTNNHIENVHINDKDNKNLEYNDTCSDKEKNEQRNNDDVNKDNNGEKNDDNGINDNEKKNNENQNEYFLNNKSYDNGNNNDKEYSDKNISCNYYTENDNKKGNVDISELSKYIVPFFSSFDNVWRLLFFYALAVSENFETVENIISCILPLVSDEQLIKYIRYLIQVLSYDETEKVPFCNMLEYLIRKKSQVFTDTNELIPSISTMFSQLHIPPFSIVKFILTYQANFPEVSLSSFQLPFSNAFQDVKNNQEVLQAIITYLCSLENKEVIRLLHPQKYTALLTKLFTMCDKASVSYPQFISSFSSFDSDGFDWSGSIIAILSDPTFFAHKLSYLSTTMEAVKSVTKNCTEKIVPLLFDMLSKTESLWRSSGETVGIRNLKLLSFIILSCEYDFFINRQQSINAQLMQFLTNENSKFEVFKTFSLFIRVIFMRFSSRVVESFMSIIAHELTVGFSSDNDNIRTQSEILMRAAIMKVPASFQFTEFAFIPDLITFPENDDLEGKQWPILKESSDSLFHLSPSGSARNCSEIDLLREFIENEE